MSDLDYFRDDLCPSCKGLSEQSIQIVIEIGTSVLVVTQESLSLIVAGMCQGLFTSQGTVIVELVEKHLKGVKYVSSFPKVRKSGRYERCI